MNLPETADRIYQPLPQLPPDIEIAHGATLRPIADVARDAGLAECDLEPYGQTKAKISESTLARLAGAPQGRLILVTAMTATRAGEGKTVTCIGLSQALSKLGVKTMLALREPSLGPTFGIKGGAAGGGWAQVLPMDEINMHFTGDLHAVTSAHNLLAAVVDNHMFHGNSLGIDPARIEWRRALDLCDRQLRSIEVGLGGTNNGFPYRTGFDITAASEVMAILALSENIGDLTRRLDNILIGWTGDGRPVLAGELAVTGAMTALLKDALKPNLVQTIEGTPALIHCGPFGNIAHGCNSVRATRLALQLADVVVTEAGFAADLGAEKFMHIKCRGAGLRPSAAVVVVTVRALKMHGGVAMEALGRENVAALKAGLANVQAHVENLRHFDLPVILAVNRFPSDTPAELDAIFDFAASLDLPAALSEVAARGGEGGRELAETVMAALENGRAWERPLPMLYEPAEPLRRKIERIATTIYRAEGVDYGEEANAEIERLERHGMDQLPVCMAKTQLSLSDDPKRLGAPRGWRLRVRQVRVSHGAGFVVVVTGKVLLMPGMPERPATERISVDAEGRIHGLS